MGEVLLVERDDVRGALKRIHPWFAGDEEFRSRFAREIEVCGRVGGPNVAELLDADTSASDPWYVTEYIEGPTLQSRVDINGPLEGDDLDRLARGLLDGLHALSDAGVVHRDLKPSNVLMADGMRPVLVDFGIAAAMEATAMTATGARLGTPGWMPPEQLLGPAEWDGRADVYGWAALVAFASSGVPPFGTGRPGAVSHRVLTATPDLSTVPDRYRSAVAAAMVKDPSARPDLDVLTAALQGDHQALSNLPRIAPTIRTTSVEPGPSITEVPAPTDIARSGSDNPIAATEADQSRRLETRLIGVAIAVGAAALAAVLWLSRDNPDASPITAADSPSTTATTTPATTASTSPPTTASALGARDWLNSPLEVECSSQSMVVDLTDGHWSEHGENRPSLDVTVTDVVLIDLDDDGSDEAVIEATCTGGSRGIFEQALLFDELAGRVARVGRPVVGEQVTREERSWVTRDPSYDGDGPLCCPTHYEYVRYLYSPEEPGLTPTDFWRGEYTGSGQPPEEVYEPGDPCEPGSYPDCVDRGDGEYRYVEGYTECTANLPDSPGLCADLDGDGHAGYPDSQ